MVSVCERRERGGGWGGVELRSFRGRTSIKNIKVKLVLSVSLSVSCQIAEIFH